MLYVIQQHNNILVAKTNSSFTVYRCDDTLEGIFHWFNLVLYLCKSVFTDINATYSGSQLGQVSNTKTVFNSPAITWLPMQCFMCTSKRVSYIVIDHGEIRVQFPNFILVWYTFDSSVELKVGVNPSLKKEMWLLMHLITKKTCTKMYKSIHFWNQKNQMNLMVATDFCKIMRFSRNSSVTMVTIEYFLDRITKIWFY